MKRRKFISYLGAAAAAWPLAVRAQQTDKLPTIGVLQHNALGFSPWGAVFEERLRELGWIKDRTIKIEYRWSEGRPERVAEIASEFVLQRPDVIVAYGGAALVLKRVTASIPIIFAPANDPVGIGLVTNLAHPGGNATGISNQQAESSGKRLELLREVVPNLHRLAVLFDSSYPGAVRETENVQVIGRNLGIDVEPRGIQRADDIPLVINGLKGATDALYVSENALTANSAALITTDALNARIPTAFTSREPALAGGLIAYGPNFPAMFARVADMVDKILRGAKPSDLPVEQPTKFDLVINLSTAKALGLTVPDRLLSTADEVIE